MELPCGWFRDIGSIWKQANSCWRVLDRIQLQLDHNNQCNNCQKWKKGERKRVSASMAGMPIFQNEESCVRYFQCVFCASGARERTHFKQKWENGNKDLKLFLWMQKIYKQTPLLWWHVECMIKSEFLRFMEGVQQDWFHRTKLKQGSKEMYILQNLFCHMIY